MAFDVHSKTNEIWKVLPGGVHAFISVKLVADEATIAAANDLKAASDDDGRKKALEVMVRRSGNCIGQAIQQIIVRKKKINNLIVDPNKEGSSIFKLAMGSGSAAEFAEAINASPIAQADIQNHDADVLVTMVSRMTGRCFGQFVAGKSGRVLDFLRGKFV